MSGYRFFTAVFVFGLLGLLVGCGEREQVAIAAKDSDIRTKDGIIVQDQADKQQLSDMNNKLAEQNSQVLTTSIQATKEVRDQVADLQNQLKDFNTKVEARMAAANATGGQSAGGIKITVASTEFFEPGKAVLKKSSHPLLMKMAHVLNTKYAKNFVRIEGHTDSTPVVHSKDKFADNMALSLARASAVYDFLVKEGKVPANRLYTAGYGEHQPLVWPEKTAADRAKNRRVEVVIMPAGVKIQKDRVDGTVAASTTAAKRK